MAEKELGILVRLRDQASAELRQINQNVKTSTDSWRRDFGAIAMQARNIGIAMTGIGASILGVFGMAAKAALEERLGIQQLSGAMANVGLSYKKATDEGLEKWITATQRATGIADSEQRQALSLLIPMTNDLSEAQSKLQLAMDMAAGTGKDLKSTITLISYAISGNWGMVERYIPAIKQAELETDKWRLLNQLFAGQAENVADPINVLKAAISDLSEEIGNALLPKMRKVIDDILEVIEAADGWIKKNPKIIETLTEVGIAVGIGAVTTGLLTTAVVGLALAFAYAGGPITLIIIGIGLLIAAATFLILKWDWVKENWISIFSKLSETFRVFVDHWDKSKDFWVNIWNVMKVVALNSINDLIRDLNKLLSVINLVGKVFGQNWKIQIPEISEEAWNIFRPMLGPAYPMGPPWIPSIPSGVLKGTEPISPIDAFGAYGKLGKSFVLPGGITITINNAGSVIAERDLTEQIRQALIDIQNRNVTTGLE